MMLSLEDAERWLTCKYAELWAEFGLSSIAAITSGKAGRADIAQAMSAANRDPNLGEFGLAVGGAGAGDFPFHPLRFQGEARIGRIEEV